MKHMPIRASKIYYSTTHQNVSAIPSNSQFSHFTSSFSALHFFTGILMQKMCKNCTLSKIYNKDLIIRYRRRGRGRLDGMIHLRNKMGNWENDTFLSPTLWPLGIFLLFFGFRECWISWKKTSHFLTSAQM